jgi:5-bromo-4-chloroindolyl phosphate hydrolysis protein
MEVIMLVTLIVVVSYIFTTYLAVSAITTRNRLNKATRMNKELNWVISELNHTMQDIAERRGELLSEAGESYVYRVNGHILLFSRNPWFREPLVYDFIIDNKNASPRAVLELLIEGDPQSSDMGTT